MNLEELRKFKPQIEEIAAKYGVTDIRVFGSVARGDATEDSDVDFLVNPKNAKSGFALGGFYGSVEELLNKKVDVLTPNSVHWYVKRNVFEESVRL